MKIDYVLVGSNDNPLYLDFWPVISKVWKTIFNITPVLGYITKEKEEIIHDEYGIIIKFNNIEGYDDGLLSQLVRLYLPKYLNGNCIISDIDMIPLSKNYFINSLEEFSDSDFIVLSSHHPQTVNTNQYPMCYIAGNDTTFKKLFNLDDDWITFINKIPNFGWYTDQIHVFNVINQSNTINIKFPNRVGGFYENRIDRGNWRYDINLLKNGFYIDCHSLRPYNDYKNQINDLINLLT
jgi:hypothetical protein